MNFISSKSLRGIKLIHLYYEWTIQCVWSYLLRESNQEVDMKEFHLILKLILLDYRWNLLLTKFGVLDRTFSALQAKQLDL